MTEGRSLFFSLALVAAIWWGAGGAAAQEAAETGDDPPAPRGLLAEISGGFYWRMNVEAFGIVQKPVLHRLTPETILGVHRYQTEMDLRPDFSLNFRRLELTLKPRLELRWRKWSDGVLQTGDRTSDELFVNEGSLRYRVIDPLIVSYGREVVQWGPSYLLSPSNPFNQNNGRDTPFRELPGLGYGKVMWIASDAWTGSLIANIDKGRLELNLPFNIANIANIGKSRLETIRPFKKSFALKLDYTGAGKYLTVVPSYREDGNFKFGFFGGWTVSDALLLYTEGSVSDEARNPKILMGGAYTLELGPTLGVEFFRNQNGCTREPIFRCFVAGIGNSDPADILFRRNYLMLQYVHTRIRDSADFILRWIHNLDDHSHRVLGILNYDLGDRTRLFVVGNFLPGNKGTEFGFLLDYSVALGVNFTF